jgi:hypothetical protein
MNFPWAADWAASTLSGNRQVLSKRFPGLSEESMTAAMIASWNIGLGGVSRNIRKGRFVDTGSTDPAYSANILNIMKCI